MRQHRFYKSVFNQACLVGAALLSNPGISAFAQQTSNLDTLFSDQGQYQALISDAKDAYSGELHSLEKELNNYRVRNTLTAYTKIIYLDPIQADVGLAIGLPPSMVIQTMLLKNQVFPDPELIKIFNHHLFSYPNDDEKNYTQEPLALFPVYADGRKGACIIIPAPPNTIPQALVIPGLNIGEAREFFNLHEGWHCLDKVYHGRTFPLEVYATFDEHKRETLIGNQAGLEAYSNMALAESFADTAAVGEKIRQGKPLAFIDIIAEWRSNTIKDLKHLSSPVLRGLKKEIENIGLERFRGMNEEEARNFYYSITGFYGLNVSRLEIKIKYDQASPDQQRTMRVSAQADLDFQKSIAFEEFKSSAGAPTLVNLFTEILGGKGLSETEIQRKALINAKLDSWKPMDDLMDQAFAAERSITPASLSRAYIRMQTDLSFAIDQDPQNADFYGEKATRLKMVFVGETARQDFAGQTLRHLALPQNAPLLP